ncbi:hypothetical protein [Fodinibius halophilus]|uniref:hypothetical protein n=1 Tax=Fodinibius halophilus TaxID=1736908 RepID=UPI00197AD67D|nr:hypothetical protein [Fodinibius halophilus]
MGWQKENELPGHPPVLSAGAEIHLLLPVGGQALLKGGQGEKKHFEILLLLYRHSQF